MYNFFYPDNLVEKLKEKTPQNPKMSLVGCLSKKNHFCPSLKIHDPKNAMQQSSRKGFLKDPRKGKKEEGEWILETGAAQKKKDEKERGGGREEWMEGGSDGRWEGPF